MARPRFSESLSSARLRPSKKVIKSDGDRLRQDRPYRVAGQATTARPVWPCAGKTQNIAVIVARPRCPFAAFGRQSSTSGPPEAGRPCAQRVRTARPAVRPRDKVAWKTPLSQTGRDLLPPLATLVGRPVRARQKPRPVAPRIAGPAWPIRHV